VVWEKGGRRECGQDGVEGEAVPGLWENRGASSPPSGQSRRAGRESGRSGAWECDEVVTG
jgi:hypothetical protein